MSVLLEGTLDQVRAWGEGVAGAPVSCRELLRGQSPRVARAFANMGLRLVHRALVELPRPASGELGETYIRLCLHEAVTSSPASGWVISDDDARHVVALEIAQRLRTTCAPLFGSTRVAAIDARTVTRLFNPHDSANPPAPSRGTGTVPRVLEFVGGLVQADLAEEQGGNAMLGKLKRLQVGFGLTQRELARLLGVRPQAVRKWLSGGGMSADVRAAVDGRLAELQRLESHFTPGLLPSVLRRPDRGLRGRKPITMVIDGRAAEFADYVERIIADDRTA